MKKMLIICDSHGTKWGAVGYAWQLKNNFKDFDIDILEFGGISIKKIIEDESLILKIKQNYDIVLVGLGNADVHPRMPKTVIDFLKKIGLSFIRDAYFTIPPVINLSYILRLPFFILRIFLLRYFYESYLNEKEFFNYFNKLITMIETKNNNIVILPLFKVNSNIYTDSHNIATDNINSKLEIFYNNYFFNSLKLEHKDYKKYYNFDGFHFRGKFHQNISTILMNHIKKIKPAYKNADKVLCVSN